MRLVSLVLLGSLGCAMENTVERRNHTDTFQQEPSAEVDILWVVDNSPSMAEEQALLALAFEDFIASIDETNIDFHIGVVTTDMDLGNTQRGMLLGETPYLTAEDDYVLGFQERVMVGTEGSDKEKGLAAALHAITEPMASGPNAGFLRPSATLAINFVSDEDDCSDNESLAGESGDACYDQRDQLVAVRQYIEAFRDLKDPGVRVVASSVVGPEVDRRCDQSWPGHRYWTIAEKTGGIVADICETNYDAIMSDLGLAVAGEVTVFYLTYAAMSDSIEVWADDMVLPMDTDDGWVYDNEYRSIRFDGGYVPPRGSTVTVRYEVAGT